MIETQLDRTQGLRVGMAGDVIRIDSGSVTTDLPSTLVAKFLN